MIKVLIIDDHRVTRMGIKFFIEQDESIQVVAEAANAEEGFALRTAHDPDVVLVDINMPKVSGIEAIKDMISTNPETKIIVLTGSGNHAEIKESLSAGAKGFCLKDIDHTNLISAIKKVADGEMWLGNDFDANNHNNKSALTNKTKQLENSYDLSARELQVLRLVAEGWTNQTIANELKLSVDTVKSHLKTIMQKLAVSDRTLAAVKAARENIV